jgi:branched-chain amino acid aminotransferase
MICTMSKHEAEAAGYHDALMLDYRGYVSEATGANIFLVQDGVIHTPRPDCFLDGITRRTVMELAKIRQFEVVERHIKPEELAHTQEVFLTGTAAEVTPVGEIDGQTFLVGDITRALIEDYEKLVREGGGDKASTAA